ncbi:MAG: hypothetical protein CR992_00985, partial [Desulfobacterales bacterium]
MVQEGMITDPLSEADLTGLQLIERTWGRREILRAQLSRLSKTRRRQLINSADLETKWERYAYSRFNNLNKGERLTLKKLFDEIEITFGFKLKPAHKARIYNVRRRVYNERNKSLK